MDHEMSIMDLKSTDQAQPEKVTEIQLHIYALSYQELTGGNADYVDIYILDKRKKSRARLMKHFSVA
jgi:DNA helicase-2/ATP-dependent DNA helicase PcrA